MATALKYDTNQKTKVNGEATNVIKEATYRDVNNWSPAHIYHEISGYTKLSDINKKGNLSRYVAYSIQKVVKV